MARAVREVIESMQQALALLTIALEKTNQDLYDNRVCLDSTRENRDALMAKIRADVAKLEAEVHKTTVPPPREYLRTQKGHPDSPTREVAPTITLSLTAKE